MDSEPWVSEPCLARLEAVIRNPVTVFVPTGQPDQQIAHDVQWALEHGFGGIVGRLREAVLLKYGPFKSGPLVPLLMGWVYQQAYEEGTQLLLRRKTTSDALLALYGLEHEYVLADADADDTLALMKLLDGVAAPRDWRAIHNAIRTCREFPLQEPDLQDMSVNPEAVKDLIEYYDRRLLPHQLDQLRQAVAAMRYVTHAELLGALEAIVEDLNAYQAAHDHVQYCVLLPAGRDALKSNVWYALKALQLGLRAQFAVMRELDDDVLALVQYCVTHPHHVVHVLLFDDITYSGAQVRETINMWHGSMDYFWPGSPIQVYACVPYVHTADVLENTHPAVRARVQALSMGLPRADAFFTDLPLPLRDELRPGQTLTYSQLKMPDVLSFPPFLSRPFLASLQPNQRGSLLVSCPRPETSEKECPSGAYKQPLEKLKHLWATIAHAAPGLLVAGQPRRVNAATRVVTRDGPVHSQDLPRLFASGMLFALHVLRAHGVPVVKPAMWYVTAADDRFRDDEARRPDMWNVRLRLEGDPVYDTVFSDLRRPLTRSEKQQAANIVNSMHAAGVAHRGLSLGSFAVNPRTGAVTLTDFATAQVFAAGPLVSALDYRTWIAEDLAQVRVLFGSSEEEGEGGATGGGAGGAAGSGAGGGGAGGVAGAGRMTTLRW